MTTMDSMDSMDSNTPMQNMDGGAQPMQGMDHSQHQMAPANPLKVPSKKARHARTEYGPSTDARVDTARTNLDDPGVGLRNNGRRVLTLADMHTIGGPLDNRGPEREVELHLTGNMERFMWSFDGEKFSEGVEPIRFERNERARVVLINDTMMTHPIHLHGHFFEVVTGNPGHHPVKHTVNVLPGGKVSFDLTADGPGDWAFHCHMLLHMMSGMFRVVTVRKEEDAA